MANRLNVANIGYNDATDALTIDSSGNVTAAGTLTPSTLDVSAGTLTLADNQISGDKVEGGTITSTTITSLTTGTISEAVTNAGVSIDGLTLKDGGIQFRTATGSEEAGVAFGAGTLDDYEEGTWTPVLGGSTTNPTISQPYQAQVGHYKVIGKLCFLEFYIYLPTSGVTAGTGTATITGIPFDISGVQSQANGTVAYSGNWDTTSGGDEAPVSVFGYIDKLYLRRNTTSGQGGYENVSATIIRTSTLVSGSISYTIA